MQLAISGESLGYELLWRFTVTPFNETLFESVSNAQEILFEYLPTAQRTIPREVSLQYTRHLLYRCRSHVGVSTLSETSCNLGLYSEIFVLTLVSPRLVLVNGN